MRMVLLDSVGLLAIWNRHDQWHPQAKAAMAKADVAGTRFISTPYILAECSNAAARSPFRSEVFLLRQRLIRQGNLIPPNEGEADSAWAAYSREGVGGAGVVDQISFAVMRRLGIIEVLSNDHHFKAAGFVELF